MLKLLMKNDACFKIKLDGSDYHRLKQLVQNILNEGFRIIWNLSRGTQCMPVDRESVDMMTRHVVIKVFENSIG